MHSVLSFLSKVDVRYAENSGQISLVPELIT